MDKKNTNCNRRGNALENLFAWNSENIEKSAGYLKSRDVTWFPVKNSSQKAVQNDNNNNNSYGTCAHFGITWQFGLNHLIGSYGLTFLNNSNNDSNNDSNNNKTANFTINLHCWSQLKNVESSGIWNEG